MKIKMFGKINMKEKKMTVLDLENDINDWLEKHPHIKIINIIQSSNGGSWNFSKLFISIIYEETA
jgi:hypothetical protein